MWKHVCRKYSIWCSCLKGVKMWLLQWHSLMQEGRLHWNEVNPSAPHLNQLFLAGDHLHINTPLYLRPVLHVKASPNSSLILYLWRMLRTTRPTQRSLRSLVWNVQTSWTVNGLGQLPRAVCLMSDWLRSGAGVWLHLHSERLLSSRRSSSGPRCKQ